VELFSQVEITHRLDVLLAQLGFRVRPCLDSVDVRRINHPQCNTCGHRGTTAGTVDSSLGTPPRGSPEEEGKP
jgi:hypothetical protein